MYVRSRAKTTIEVTIITGAALAALIYSQSPRATSIISLWLAPGFFLYAPLIAVAATDQDLSPVGLCKPAWKTVALDFSLYLFIILPLFLLGWIFLARLVMGVELDISWPGHLAGLLVWQLLGVSLPEELFFRGWLQGRLNQVLGTTRLLRAQAGPGLFIAALMFAGAHFIIEPSPGRLLVFFPGLLFGFLRERSGSIAVPVLAHTAGNFCFIIVQSWAGAWQPI